MLKESFAAERAWRSGLGIADGEDIEKGVLGAPVLKPREKMPEEYMAYKDAVAWVREHQPDAFSRSKLIKNLRTRVAELCTNIDEPVKFYTAVGTPLDIYHGVDAFFAQGHKIATVDLSMKEKENYKADVLMTVAFDSNGEPVSTERALQMTAEAIADTLNRA